MTLRTRPSRPALAPTASALAAVALAAVTVVGAAPAAHAAGGSGTVQLTLTKQGPVFGDNDTLIYNIVVTNHGPATATGLVLSGDAWYCPLGAYDPARCRVMTDPNNPGVPLVGRYPLADLAPGQSDSFPVVGYLPNEQSGTVRTTVEVWHVDQEDSASTPGTCDQGWNPQPDCVSDVVDVS